MTSRDHALKRKLVASRYFGQAVETRAGLEEAVSVYTARAAEKMRRQNLATASIAVWVETNSFKTNDRQYSASKAVRLPVATADTGKLIAAATAGLKIIFKPGYRYKKAGVTFFDLVAADQVQGGLFDRPDDARSMRRMKAIDQLNGRFGRGTIGFGTAGERQGWGLRQEFVSPRYTTVWEELLRVCIAFSSRRPVRELIAWHLWTVHITHILLIYMIFLLRLA